jgi:hypothetical protein
MEREKSLLDQAVIESLTHPDAVWRKQRAVHAEVSRGRMHRIKHGIGFYSDSDLVINLAEILKTKP